MTGEQKSIIEAEGRRFRHFREKAHLSREQAAEKLGVSSRTLASYERGERGISFKKAVKMTEIYNTTFVELTAYKRIIKNLEEDSEEIK